MSSTVVHVLAYAGCTVIFIDVTDTLCIFVARICLIFSKKIFHFTCTVLVMRSRDFGFYISEPANCTLIPNRVRLTSYATSNVHDLNPNTPEL